jgi:hypothetical protein
MDCTVQWLINFDDTNEVIYANTKKMKMEKSLKETL